MLAGVGFEVHFLLRSDYDHVAKNGLTVRSNVNRDLHLANVHARRSATAMSKCDWLLIGAKRPVMPTLCQTIIRSAGNGAKVIVLPSICWESGKIFRNTLVSVVCGNIPNPWLRITMLARQPCFGKAIRRSTLLTCSLA